LSQLHFAAINNVINYSLISSRKDAAPTWKAELIRSFREKFYEPIVRSGKDGPAWCPATFGDIRNEKGNLRHNGNVTHVTALVLDLDGKDAVYGEADLKKRLAGFKHVAHSTWSSMPECPRWRVILFLEMPISPTQLPAALTMASEITGLSRDTSCDNPSHLFYLPSVPPEREDAYRVLQGAGVPIDCHPAWKKEKDIAAQGLSPSSLSTASENESKGKHRGTYTPTTHTPTQAKHRGTHTPTEAKHRRTHTPIQGKHRRTKNAAVPLCLASDCTLAHVEALASRREFTEDDIIQLFNDRHNCLAITRLPSLRIPAQAIDDIEAGKVTSSEFCSILPWRQDREPSCVIRMKPGTEMILYDHGDSRKTYSLPMLAMALAYKRAKEKGEYGVELIVWRLRLLIEAGILSYAPVPDLPPCPGDVRPTVRQVYEGFKQLMGCKRLVRKWAGNPTAFTKAFASAWCGVGVTNAHNARLELADKGIIQIVGQQKRMCLYLPGPHQKHPKAQRAQRAQANRRRQKDQELRRSIGPILAKMGVPGDPVTMPVEMVAEVLRRARCNPDLTTTQRFLIASWESALTRKASP
jgi:hypothetical protein